MAKLPENPNCAAERLVSAANAYLEEHLTEKFSLAEISRALYINRNYLARAYKRVTGHTLLWFHHYLRCEKAKKLLSETDSSVSDIGESLGYATAAHFSQVFRKMNGKSPSDWRAGVLRGS